jgi:diguanylate cyclase (GGDEF)-like protein
MSVDWSKFTPLDAPATAAAPAVDWSQFTPVDDAPGAGDLNLLPRARAAAGYVGDVFRASADAAAVGGPRVGPISPDVDRSWGELFGDIKNQLAAGIGTGAAAIAETPVNLANLVSMTDPYGLPTPPGPKLFDQPDIVKAFAERARGGAKNADERLSDRSFAMSEDVANADGAAETVQAVLRNPAMLPELGARVVGQMAPAILPGAGTAANLAAQSMSAGSANAADVAVQLRAAGVPEEEVARRITETFGIGTALNLVLARIIPGGTAFERMLGGAMPRPGVGTAARVAIPVVGEPAAEGATGGLEQVASNIATDAPIERGVGSAAALEAVMGAGMGTVAGVTDAVRATAPARVFDAAAAEQSARTEAALADSARRKAVAAFAPPPPQPVSPAPSPAAVPTSPPAAVEPNPFAGQRFTVAGSEISRDGSPLTVTILQRGNNIAAVVDQTGQVIDGLEGQIAAGQSLEQVLQHRMMAETVAPAAAGTPDAPLAAAPIPGASTVENGNVERKPGLAEGRPAGQQPAGPSGPVGPVGLDAQPQVSSAAPLPAAPPNQPAASIPPERAAAEQRANRFSELRTRRKGGEKLPEPEAAELLDLYEDARGAAVVGGREMPGVRNFVAYRDRQDEGTLKPAQSYLDGDDFKRINDELGHDAGDVAIGSIADALLQEFGEGNVFHRSGDEFFVQGATPAEIDAGMERARERLKGATLTYTAPDGTVTSRTGIGFSYGTGATNQEAEARAKADKQARKDAGLRTGARDRATDVGPSPVANDGGIDAGAAQGRENLARDSTAEAVGDGNDRNNDIRVSSNAPSAVAETVVQPAGATDPRGTVRSDGSTGLQSDVRGKRPLSEIQVEIPDRRGGKIRVSAERVVRQIEKRGDTLRALKACLAT